MIATQPLLERPTARGTLLGAPTITNAHLASALTAHGHDTHVKDTLDSSPGSFVLGRLDVLPTLDGVERGLAGLRRAEERGVHVLNRAGALLNAHDKLATALLLGRAGVPQPRTAHVRGPEPPAFGPPWVVKPRFGSWGRDVHLCATLREFRGCVARLAHRPWFGRQGALVQELIPPTGRDLRVVVARGRVVGAVERKAARSEWRTNVALGAERSAVSPAEPALRVALAAAAALGIDLAGVDLLLAPDGRWLVLEMNGAVDFTHDYGLAGADPFQAAAEALGPAEAALSAA